MIYTEAKKEIDSRIELARKHYPEVPDYIEALEMASEALGKQIPQKAIEEISKVRGFPHICPSCSILVGYLHDYCEHCGQALEWSKE